MPVLRPVNSLPPRCSSNVRSVVSSRLAPSMASTTAAMASPCSASVASTVISRTAFPSPSSTVSMSPIDPPASPIAVATRPSIPGRRSNSTRRVRENCALGAAIAMGREIVASAAAGAAVEGSSYRAPYAGNSGPGLAFLARRARPRAYDRAVAAADSRELFLIDGNSLVYRAFYALPETIATSKGVPTNAIFGFASMLVKILTEYGPKTTLVVWDAGQSGRREISADYKADRKERPDLLSEQWPQMEPLVEAFGYRNVKVPGYEADDVIATLAQRARSEGIEVMVVTGDRDSFQLIEDGVRVMATSRGITETKIYDRDAVIERYDIPPELIPDFYGLKGDTSDNIPGVPGIGDKTASQLLQQFGSLEGVLDHVDDISGAKRKQNLTEHADDARVSKVLATIVRDVPGLDLDLEAELGREHDRPNLRAIFREWELRDPLRRLEEALAAAELDTIPRPEQAAARRVPTRPGSPADVAAPP